MLHQTLLNRLSWFNKLGQSNHFSAVLALSLSLILAACGGGGSSVTENNLVEPGADGVAPTLTSVTIANDFDSSAYVALDDVVLLEFESDEALMQPTVMLGGVAADVSGSVRSWKATRAMVEGDEDGVIEFTISFSDVSGEAGVDVTTTSDESTVQYCAAGCPRPSEEKGIVGDWKLAAEAEALGVGPGLGDTGWWKNSVADVTTRACLFDDIFRFDADGTFYNVMGDETWLEPWQGATAESCGRPVAPHDGSNAATYVHDEAANTLTINGLGAHIGLPKVTNGAEIDNTANASASIVYTVSAMTATTMTLDIQVAGTGHWRFKLAKVVPPPFAGDWKLAAEAEALGVGPALGDTGWWKNSAADVTTRACLFDDVFRFGKDGTFENIMGAETWLEPWQGATAESCGRPVAPHDGSNAATYAYDEDAGTITVSGLGAHIGLAKVINGAEIDNTANAASSIVYTLTALTDTTMTLDIQVAGTGHWRFKLAKVVPPPFAGDWKLAAEAEALGVGPALGDTGWWKNSAADVTTRACLFDDVFRFGEDGSFENIMGAETWLEPWQGATAESCGRPVAPHDGSNAATYAYDEDAGTITVSGLGAHIGLAKVINGAEIDNTANAASSIVYTLTALTDTTMTLDIQVAGTGHWRFKLAKVLPPPVSGDWKLVAEAEAIGVGPALGDTGWWKNSEADVTTRACLFDDVFRFGKDGSFENIMGTETWLEPWQGATAESCGAPVAPHNGSNRATYTYDESGKTLTIDGLGAHIGLAKVVNGDEIDNTANAASSIVYTVTALSNTAMTLDIQVGGTGHWRYKLRKL